MNSNLKKSFDVFLIFLKLGLTSFGGPIAHLGYFHQEFVTKRKWLDDRSFADIVTLCQALPGPASSQVGIIIGHNRAGLAGSLAAWMGFTLPSAILLIFFSLTFFELHPVIAFSVGKGIKLVALVVVGQAIWSMGKTLCPDKRTRLIAATMAFFALNFSTTHTQVILIFFAAVVGAMVLKSEKPTSRNADISVVPLTLGVTSLVSFTALLVLLPPVALWMDSHALILFEKFYRAGSLIFGGGHTALPLLKAEVVNNGWVTPHAFTLGYGITQAMPGPLFSFSAYLGAMARQGLNPWFAGSLALCGAFLPSFLIVFGTLPLWNKTRSKDRFRNALAGVNACVVGILLAAFYNPIFISSVESSKDFSFAILFLAVSITWKTPNWALVLTGGVLGLLAY